MEVCVRPTGWMQRTARCRWESYVALKALGALSQPGRLRRQFRCWSSSGTSINNCFNFFGSEIESFVCSVNRSIDLIFGNDNGNANFGGGNHVDINSSTCEGFKKLCGNSRCRAHACTHDGYLAHSIVIEQLFKTDRVLQASKRCHCGLPVAARQGERNIGDASGCC